MVELERRGAKKMLAKTPCLPRALLRTLALIDMHSGKGREGEGVEGGDGLIPQHK